jgi:Icc-related predicted phosphoesterase
MTESIRDWVGLAEERLSGTGIRCIINGGNDDQFEIDPILQESDYVEHPEGSVLWIDDHHEMISTGYSNISPWEGLPRDISEEDLKNKISEMVAKVQNMENAIFNFHCPPYDTGIDGAPKLDEELKPVTIGGQLMTIPVGSIAVREAIEEYQPLLELHGHIQESKGSRRVGRTLCLNLGSEYPEGVL